MARIPEQIIEQVRSASDIIEVISGYVQLKKRGRNYFGLCPFHGEKTSSFSVSSEKQIFKCFGCGIGGSVINFIMEIEGIDFVSSIKLLANQYNIEIKLENNSSQSKDLITQLLDIYTNTAHFFYNNLKTEEGSRILAHLESRGLNIETIKKFKLGYSLKQKDTLLSIFRKNKVSANIMKQSGLFISIDSGYIDRFRGRIMFSISNSSGKIVAFAGRVVDSKDSAKYVNSLDSPIYNKSKILYGLNETKHKIREKKSVIVVEGYLDFLQLYQSGIHNIIAVCGTALTEQHATQIKRFCEVVYISYDGDSAGRSAAIRAGYVLLKTGLTPFIVNIPDGIDPDDWVKKEGKAPFLEAVEKSENLLHFHFKNYSGNINETTGKTQFVNDVLLEIAQIKDPVSRELQAKELSEFMGVSIESVFQSLNSLLEKQNYRRQFQKKTQESLENDNNNKYLLENDLIRLCFANDVKIRKFLFDSVKLEWLMTELSQTIYEKVYIHLPSKNAPEPSLIINELNNNSHRNIFADLIFDLEKLSPSLNSAQDCIIRLEEKWIDTKINFLRNELKNAESSKNDPIPFMQKIDELQIRKKELFIKYS